MSGRASLYAACARLARRAFSFRCRLVGHRWIDHPLSYRPGKVYATVGVDPYPQQINCTWVCDEVCARCGVGSWWPS